MANRYILAYYDELNNMRLFPEIVHVNPGDNVIWASNLDEQYVAGDFSPSGLFPDSAYEMPPNDQSPPAPVQMQIAPQPAIPYLYTCSLAGGAAAGDGGSGSGIIIVDPPGKGHHRRMGKKRGAGKKKGR